MLNKSPQSSLASLYINLVRVIQHCRVWAYVHPCAIFILRNPILSLLSAWFWIMVKSSLDFLDSWFDSCLPNKGFTYHMICKNTIIIMKSWFQNPVSHHWFHLIPRAINMIPALVAKWHISIVTYTLVHVIYLIHAPLTLVPIAFRLWVYIRQITHADVTTITCLL